MIDTTSLGIWIYRCSANNDIFASTADEVSDFRNYYACYTKHATMDPWVTIALFAIIARVDYLALIFFV